MKIIGSLIMFFLFIFAFIFTQRHGKVELGEYVCKAPLYQINDNIVLNIICVIFYVLLVILLLHLNKKYQAVLMKLDKVLFFATPLIIGIVSLYWVWNSGAPIHDQMNIYNAAISFNQKDYSYLVKGAYLNLYPQQLGIIGFYQILLRLFRTEDYRIIQYVNCIFIVGIVILLYLCLKLIRGKSVDRILLSISSLVLLPLILYASFVYGEVPSTFFLFLFCYFILQLYQKKLYKYALLAGISGSFMLILRINTAIALIAFLIISVVYCLNYKNWQLLIISVLISVCCLFPVKGIQLYYEHVSGYEVDGGLPYELWIAMGISEEASKPGWYDHYPVTTYLSVNMDKEQASQQAFTKIKQRLELFINTPIEGLSFYKRKICTQWNDPTFNFYHNSLGGTFTQDEYTKTSLMDKILNHIDSLLTFLSVSQLIVYGGTLLYALKRHSPADIFQDIFLLTIIGGFLFSILWEADSRYVLPYYICMLPCALRGWVSFVQNIICKIKRIGTCDV